MSRVNFRPEPFEGYTEFDELGEFNFEAPSTPYTQAPGVASYCQEYRRWLQLSLNQTLGSRLSVDGAVGPNTFNSIKNFQSKNGLTANGRIDLKLEEALVKSGAAPPPISFPPPAAGGGPAWVRGLTPLLNQYRGSIPLDFLIGWIAVESGGCVGEITAPALDERGYFQIHKDERKLNDLTLDGKPLDPTLLATNPEYSIRAGVELVRHYMRSAKNLGFTPGTDLFWHMVKFLHTGSGYVEVILNDMRKTGASPTSWTVIREHVKNPANKARLRQHRFFITRDPESLINNVDNLFRQGQLLTPRSNAAHELRPEVANFLDNEANELTSFETEGGGWQGATPGFGLKQRRNSCFAKCRAERRRCVERGMAPHQCDAALQRCLVRCGLRQTSRSGYFPEYPLPARTPQHAAGFPGHQQFFESEALAFEVVPEAESERYGGYRRRRPSSMTMLRSRARRRHWPRKRFRRTYSGASYPVFAPTVDPLSIYPTTPIDFSDQPSGDVGDQTYYSDTMPPPPEATSAIASDGVETAAGDADPEFFENKWLDPETSEMFDEWMGEVSRSSSEYIRWVQTSLNQIQGLHLDVDGISGPLTRSAVRSFQQRAAILVDGIVGPQTEGALIKFGASPPPGSVPVAPPKSLTPLTAAEQAELARLNASAQAQFRQLRTTLESYTGVAQREADKGSRTLLRQGHFRQNTQLLPEIIRLTNISTLPSGWSLAVALPLLVGNVLYNLAFPETINQGGWDRLGGQPDPTCFSASTQILLARRFPLTYVRLTIQLATTNIATFAGGASVGPLVFVSTNLYRSLESVLLQTAFDTYFNQVIGASYTPGDELKVHRQVFGPNRPPRSTTYASRSSMVSAFRAAFVTSGGNTRPWEGINLCTGNPAVSCGNHNVVLTRVTGGRVYFYNPWANEEEKQTMFGTARVSVSGNGERPAESSMTQADFEGQLTAVFHN